MNTLRLPDPGPDPDHGRASKWVVMLPGAYSRPPEFVEAGFVQALQHSGVAADACIAGSHFGYYNDRSKGKTAEGDHDWPAWRALRLAWLAQGMI